MLRTKGPNRVSTPQVTTLHGAEVTVPQKERGAPLSIARDIGSIAWIPPRVPGESTDRHRWRWFEKVEQWLSAQQRREGR